MEQGRTFTKNTKNIIVGYQSSSIKLEIVFCQKILLTRAENKYSIPSENLLFLSMVLLRELLRYYKM